MPAIEITLTVYLLTWSDGYEITSNLSVHLSRAGAEAERDRLCAESASRVCGKSEDYVGSYEIEDFEVRP